MNTSILSRFVAAAAATCTTFTVLFCVVSLADVPAAPGAGVAQVQVVALG